MTKKNQSRIIVEPGLTPAMEATTEESTLVERVARIVSSGHEWRGAKPDFTRLAAELEPAIPFDVFGIVLLRHDRQALRITVCRRESDSWVANNHQHPLEDSKMEQLLQHPAIVVQNYPHGLDGPPSLCGDALSPYPYLRATLIAPLMVGDHILGTLELGSTHLDTYADETLQRLIKAVAHVLAAAIESAQIGGNVEIQDRQRRALKQVSNAFTSTMDLSVILERIVDGTSEALHVPSAIVTLDRYNQGLYLEAQSGLDPLILRQLLDDSAVLTDQSIIGYSLQRRQPFVSQDISADKRFPISHSFATQLAVRSIFSYPLVTDTAIYGVLLLCSQEPGGFTPLKVDILSLFAGQATIAIHNAMLLQAAQQRSHFQEAIEQFEQAHNDQVNESEMLEHLRIETERTFGVDFSSLLRFISDHLLTRNERDFQNLLQASHREDSSETPHQLPHMDLPPVSGVSTRTPSGVEALRESLNSHHGLRPTSTAWLTQTAEAALDDAEIVRELSRLLQLYERSSGDRTDAWFVVDLNGRCMYMNPAAEVFCGIRLLSAWKNATVSNSTLLDVFSAVLPGVRNAAEVSQYFQDFVMPESAQSSARAIQHFNNNTIRCVMALEPVKYGKSQRRITSSDEKRRASHKSRAGLDASRSREIRESASDRYYQLTRYPLYNQSGHLLANALQVHDITEQVHDEKNKSALLSSVSHDLRTPLTTIKAAVTGLLQPGVDWDEETRQEILEEVDRETDHLTVLINALVEMSRIEMGALVLEKELCDVAEILNSALVRVERVLANQIVNIRVPSPPYPPLPLVQVDYVQMERVFYNLIENAARRNSLHPDLSSTPTVSSVGTDSSRPSPIHRPPAEIVIALDVVDLEHETDSRKKLLRVRIIDHGSPIPENEHERIFKSFYAQESAPGGGLGLAICRGIIEAHQGQIWVESTPDGATCFTFTLPVHFNPPSSVEEFR